MVDPKEHQNDARTAHNQRCFHHQSVRIFSSKGAIWSFIYYLVTGLACMVTKHGAIVFGDMKVQQHV
jgi:hypothetical protein